MTRSVSSRRIRQFCCHDLYSFSTGWHEKVDYYETEHYRVTRNFLVDPKRMLDVLLETIVKRAGARHAPQTAAQLNGKALRTALPRARVTA